jgi:hypothetical protein
MGEVEEHLVYFLANEKSAALRAAIAKKGSGVLEDVLMRVRLSVRSMQMPLEELQQRLGTFERKISEAQRERVVANDLLTGDSKRVHEFLEEQAEALRGKARTYLEGVAKEAIAGDGGQGEDAVRERIAAVIPAFFEHHMGEMTTLFTNRIAEVLQIHQQRADDLIESIRKAAAELFDIPYRAPESASAFEMTQEPYWVTHKWTASLGLIPQEFIDRLLPERVRKARMMKRLIEQAGGLVISNVENIRWTIYQSLDRSFIRFGSTLDKRLASTIEATHGAIRIALAKRKEHAQAVAENIALLKTTETELSRIKAHLEQDARA